MTPQTQIEPEPALPRPPAALRLGVTGHRPHRLACDHARLQAQLHHALVCFARALEALRVTHSDRFENAPPALTLVTPLAAGADSIAAQAALDAGIAIDVCMPFSIEHHRMDLDEAQVRQFDGLLGAARRVLTFPGDRLPQEEAFFAIGATVIEQSDLLLAVWDGQHEGGRGGTADIVELALASGTPVLWFDATGHAAPRLAWPRIAGTARGMVITDPSVWGSADDRTLARLVEALAPPDDEYGLAALGAQRLRPGRAYAALLALLGVDSWSKVSSRPHHGEGERVIRDAMRAFGNEEAGAFIEQRHEAADRLATAMGQRLRSAFVGNFALGAAAVALALVGLVAPDIKPVLVLAELLVIASIILRTRRAAREGWHGRWIELRDLAEQLRLLPLSASLGNLGLGLGRAGNWSAWYVQACARELGMASGDLSEQRIAAIREASLALIGDQIAYHRANARRMGAAEGRLRQIGDVLFMLTILLGAGWLAAEGFGLGHARLLGSDLAKWVTLATALLPAIGSALYGIRIQAEFASAEERSIGLERELVELQRAMAGDARDYHHLGARLRQLSAILRSELGQWRSRVEQRPLELPG